MSKEYTSHLPVCVVGHKHPDTDAICSAIAYANFKRLTSEGEYIAFRAGDLNEETRFVLNEWNVPEPPLLADARTQVRDIEIRRIPGADGELSMKRAWEQMEEADVVTLCITRGAQLKGLITTGDIVRSYMDIYDNDFLSKAKTSYKNIIDTLGAEMVLGDAEAVVDHGKVMIGAASPDMMEQLIDAGDVVIVGNRYEAQLCAIELDVQMLIVCGGAEVAQTIVKMAEDHHCAILKTKHDTFTTARLINQSVPIRYFMKSEHLVTFGQDDYIDDIQEAMAQKRYRYFPIVDEDGTYIGMISRRNFLGANRKKLILMDHNERAQAVNGVESAEILEIIDHHRVATVETVGPVFFRGQPLGSTSTIVYQMYHEQDLSIDKTTAALLLSAILSDTLMYRSPTCTPMDVKAAEDLARICGVEVEEYARRMFRAGSDLTGKTPEDILEQDFKKFSVGGVDFGVGQISSMSEEELKEIASRITGAMEKTLEHERIDMVFFALTNILTESSLVLCVGDKAKSLLEEAFPDAAETAAEGGMPAYYLLKGVVSRKKQFLPAIVEAIHH